nr:hypothetical protein [Tanacetum cinerariifolium]
TFFLALQVKQKEDGIFISQNKYVAEILKKFNFLSVKTASTPIKTQKPLVKDEAAADVDVYLYRFYVAPKTSHLHAVKRIFSKELGSPKQTALDKDISNSLMAGRFPKITLPTSALLPKQPLGMNLAALWHQQSFVLLQIKSSTSQ